MMALRTRILHLIVVGLIGIFILLYTSFSSPVSLYHIMFENRTALLNGSKPEKLVTLKVKPAALNLTPSSTSAAKKEVKVVTLLNKTLDKADQGVLTESIYVSGYNITNSELCPDLGKNLKVFVGVMSAPSHQDARMAIRQTWGHYALRQDVAFGFLLGNTKERSLLSVITQESVIYGDIIQAHFYDSYDNLTLKTISLLEWVDNYCSQVHFVLKTDDDMFINFPRFLSFIEKHWKYKKTIFGRLAKKWKPIRNSKSKYYVSLSQFSRAVFPDFTTGPAYLLTSDIVHDLYRHSMNHTYLKLEDVFTTGIVAQSINIKRVHINEFINKRIPFNICNIKKSISIHMVRYHEQFDLWKRLLDGKSKCK